MQRVRKNTMFNFKSYFIIPFYTKQYEFIPKEDLKECLVRSKGMLVITENPEEINYAKLKKYKSVLDTYTCDMKIKASTNSPLDILFGIDIGCSHIEINFPFYYSEKGLVTFIDFPVPLFAMNAYP